MKKIFEMYMALPMSVVVGGVIVTWATISSILLTPSILFYVGAWCMVLFPFLLAIHNSENKYKTKK